MNRWERGATLQMPLLFDYLLPLFQVMDGLTSLPCRTNTYSWAEVSTKTIQQTSRGLGLLCWLDSCRGYASCQNLFPCPNRTRDWPCRNWLEDPCLCLRPIPSRSFPLPFYRTLPQKGCEGNTCNLLPKERKKNPPRIVVVSPKYVSHKAPIRAECVGVIQYHSYFLAVHGPSLSLRADIQPQYLSVLEGFWAPAARTRYDRSRFECVRNLPCSGTLESLGR